MSTLSQAIAQVLRSEIGARRMDAAEFAARIDRPKTTTWRKLSGQSKITVDDMAVMAAGLGWSSEELLRRASALLESGEIHDMAEVEHHDSTTDELEANLSSRARRALDRSRAANRHDPADEAEEDRSATG